MKARQLLSLFVIGAIFIISIPANPSNYTTLCRLFKKKTKVRVPGSCVQYMVCDGKSGQVFSCENLFKYDVKTQKCTQNINTTQLCDNRCFGSKDGVWVANPTDCRSYFYCQNGEAFPSQCDIQFHFSETKQMCIYAKNSNCIDINNICELVPEGTKFRDEKDCSKYYECIKNVHRNMACGKDLYFSVEDQKCITKTNVECNAHPRVACKSSNGKIFVGLKSDGATCRGYFRCANKGIVEDLEPVWYQCPVGKFFDESMQDCVHPVDTKCNFNRCEGRGNALVTSIKNNCHNYLVCEKNVTVREEICDDDKFFNEILQACVTNIIYYKCCDNPNSYTNKTL